MGHPRRTLLRFGQAFPPFAVIASAALPTAGGWPRQRVTRGEGAGVFLLRTLRYSASTVSRRQGRPPFEGCASRPRERAEGSTCYVFERPGVAAHDSHAAQTGTATVFAARLCQLLAPLAHPILSRPPQADVRPSLRQSLLSV